MSDEIFCSSLVSWFNNGNNADEVMRNIAEASSIAGNPRDMFRPNRVYDATTRRNVGTAAERLLRWSTAAPQEIFWTGFLPSVYPSEGDYSNSTAYNLRQYVAENTNSVFVSTARFYRNDGGRLTRWERRLTEDTRHRFEYEIFAYGGIDVNHALGQHRYENQHEIAFPGGIRPEFIRLAREYMDGAIIRIWENTHFDNTINGTHVPPLAELPTLRRLPPDVPDPVPYPPHDAQPPTDDAHELCHRHSVNNDLMTGEGEGVVDNMFDAGPVSLNNVSCALHPDGGDRAYFFCGNRYAIIKINPGTTNDVLEQGPFNIVSSWSSLSKAQFASGVDAVLPMSRAGDLFFFSGKKYTLIRSKPGTVEDVVLTGPITITTGWSSLLRSGFDVIDAVLPNPINDREVYFFSGRRYVCIRYQPGTSIDYVVSGPTEITSGWASLKQAGFKTVDAILPHPKNTAAAYFFSGDQYALINISPGSSDDRILSGPSLVRTKWPSLNQAGFY